MIAKLSGGLKAMKYRILYRHRIHFGSIPHMEKGTRINLKQGEVTIGKHLSMKPGAYFAILNGGDLRIGHHVRFNRNAMAVCHESICIGDNCTIGPNTLIYDHDHKFDHEGLQPGFRTAPVRIDANCWIGANVVILRGTHIGEGSVIGAGCIVHGEIPPHSLVKSDRSLIVEPLSERR